MSIPDASHLAFRKSTYSTGRGQDCVEVADAPSFFALRDTQNRDLGHLVFPVGEWRAFLAEVKGGQL